MEEGINPLIRIQGISMTFPPDEDSEKADGLDALGVVNLSINRGEFVCVIGPSGCGKSTLIRILGGILEPTTGTVLYDGGKAPARAIVFQSSNLMPWYTVRENIALPLKIQGKSSEEAFAIADKWITKIHLSGFENEWPQNLSGGMAQRVAVARALAQEPQLLLMDEPFGALDALTRYQMSLHLMKNWERIRPAVLMVTHSISEAVLLSDRIIVFSHRPGTIIYEERINFQRPRSSELNDTPEFTAITKKLRKILVNPVS